MVWANSASTHEAVGSLKKWTIREGTIVRKMTIDRAQQHNSTSGSRVKNYHVLKKNPLVPQVHTADIPGNARLTHR